MWNKSYKKKDKTTDKYFFKKYVQIIQGPYKSRKKNVCTYESLLNVRDSSAE
jgi:hypothetical protein